MSVLAVLLSLELALPIEKVGAWNLLRVLLDLGISQHVRVGALFALLTPWQVAARDFLPESRDGVQVLDLLPGVVLSPGELLVGLVFNEDEFAVMFLGLNCISMYKRVKSI